MGAEHIAAADRIARAGVDSLRDFYAAPVYSGRVDRVRPWIGYACAAGAVAACTLAGVAMRPRFDPVNIAMLYVLAVVVVALRFTRGPAIATAVLSVLAFDFAFVPPVGTFTVDDAQYVFTFAIMLAVALAISRLTEDVRGRARDQARLAVEAETERVRATLLASISHDLRTPLAVMAGASSSLAESGERLRPEERIELARSLFEQARKMTEHVSKVLQMTRLETGALALDRDWASVGEIVGSVLRVLAETLATHRVMVEVPDDLPLLRVDAALVEQALANLLENAARHTPPGTVVRLRAQHQDREVVVSVENFGADLPEADLERVFAKFERGAMESAGGMGLGLAICRAIVRLHGGRAWAERIAGGGIAFRFSLPVEEAPAMPPEPALP
jgi:two-component system sensor histidine kinase KdpD